MKRILAILLLLAAVAGASDGPRTLRIVTWNLQWFPGGRPGATAEEKASRIVAVREEIRKLDPDIILLQEVASQEVIEETLAPLSKDWQVAVVSRFKQGAALSGQQVAIAAKMPAESAWAESWEKGWAGPPRGYAYASFMIDGKRLGIYSLHLKSNLGEAMANTSKREDAIAQLIAHLHSKDQRMLPLDAVLIAGDFNTDDPDTPGALSPGETTFGQLRREGFSWAFEGVAHADRITCPSKGRYPPACFDQMWTLGLGKPLAQPKQSDASDHLPVVIEVAVPGIANQ